MRNSIRDNITKDDIIATVNTFLKADYKHENCFVIVEGPDDLQFFRGKLKESAEILESFSGKLGVLEIVQFFNDCRVIGICDKDYDSYPAPKNCFFYDYCCLEMMIIACGTVLSSFVMTYCNCKADPQTLHDSILSDLLRISVYRKLSSINGWGVNFKGLSISNAFDCMKRKLNYNKVVSGIKKVNPCLSESSIGSHLCEVEKECIGVLSSGVDFLEITNGHDYLHYFNRLCMSYGKASSAEEMFKGLVCSFRYDDFAMTQLYETLVCHQKANKIHILVDG